MHSGNGGKLSRAQQQELALLQSRGADDGSDIIITSQGVFQKTQQGELMRVHGNSKLHPNHPKNKDWALGVGVGVGVTGGLVSGGAAGPGAGGGAALPAAGLGKKAAAEAAQAAKQAKQAASLSAAVAAAVTSLAPLADYANSFDNCTLYSSGYLNPQAGMNNKSAFDHRQVARCPVCDQPVAGGRFAPHLERCLSGGKRSGLDMSSLGGGSSKPSTVGIVSGIKQQRDPYPQSAIVRIRINVSGATQGLPKVYQDREGVSAEEWERATAAKEKRQR